MLGESLLLAEKQMGQLLGDLPRKYVGSIEGTNVPKQEQSLPEGINKRQSHIAQQEAEIWILLNQLSRRNLSDDQRAIITDELIEKQARINIAKKTSEAGKAGGKGRPKLKDSMLDGASNMLKQKPIQTRKDLSKKAKVSERKVRKARKLRKAKHDIVLDTTSKTKRYLLREMATIENMQIFRIEFLHNIPTDNTLVNFQPFGYLHL